MNRILNIRGLGDGRACIHWLMRDDAGPITTEGRIEYTSMGPMEIVAAGRWRIACRPEQNTVTPQQRGQEIMLCLRSDDTRAVTCQACMDTDGFKEQVARLEAAMAARQ